MNPFTTTGFCASDGCYYRYSDFTADFDSYTGFWAPGPRSWAVRPTTSTGRWRAGRSNDQNLWIGLGGVTW